MFTVKRNQHTEKEHYILHQICIVDLKLKIVRCASEASHTLVLEYLFKKILFCVFMCDHGKETLGSVFNTIPLTNPWCNISDELVSFQKHFNHFKMVVVLNI